MQSHNLYASKIKACLQTQKLPGFLSHTKMIPKSRLKELNHKNNIRNKEIITPKKSAVLILLYPKNNKTQLVLMVRAKDNSVHSEQVSFPGGKVEKLDVSIADTALREANEELGIIPSSVEIIGKLTKLYIPPSNFDVFPVVGITNTTPIFTANNEVKKIIETDINTLLKPTTVGNAVINNKFTSPCYYIDGEVVWGATAMILAELIEVIKKA